MKFRLPASALGAALLLGGCGPAAGDAPSGDSRHLVLVTVSSLRSDHLGIAGYPRNATPRLDLFGAAGAVLTEGITPWPETGRGAAAALTGMTPARITAGDPARLLPGPALAGMLSSAGYRTRAAVTHPALAAELGFDAGFDEYHEGLGSASAVADFAEQALAEPGPGGGGAPLFLWLHISDPEPPHPESSDEPGWDDGLTPEGPRFRSGPTPTSAATPDSAGGYGEAVDRYDAAIGAVDLATGRILDAVAEGPAAGETLVIVAGLHGESLGEHGALFARPRGLFRETLGVPILLGWPGAEADRFPAEVRFTGAVSLADIAPTALDLLGAGSALPDPRPAGYLGKSLVPALAGQDPRPHRRLYSQTAAGLFSVFDGRLRMLRIPAPGGEPAVFALFNLVRDPNEAENRYLEGRMTTEPLRAQLETRRIQSVAWIQESERAAGGPTTLSPELREALAARGYQVAAGEDP